MELTSGNTGISWRELCYGHIPFIFHSVATYPFWGIFVLLAIIFMDVYCDVASVKYVCQQWAVCSYLRQINIKPMNNWLSRIIQTCWCSIISLQWQFLENCRYGATIFMLKIVNLFPLFYLSWTVAVLIDIHFILRLVRLGFLMSHAKCVIKKDRMYVIRHREW
jgi:hypothetical protein